MNIRNSLLVLALANAAASGAMAQDHSGMDHSKMDHSTMAPSKAEESKVDQSKMDHSTMDHSTMDHSTMDHSKMEIADPSREPIPAVTDADRRAAFPEVHAHHRHGTDTFGSVLVDRLEMDDDDGYAMEAEGWVGGDIRKLLITTELHGDKHGLEEGAVDVLYSQGVRAWWDVVAGARHEFPSDRSRTWLAAGVRGFAPYKFEVSAMGYAGNGGRLMLNLEGEYETLLTNRAILQWRGEANLRSKAEPEQLLGTGLTAASLGARLRYEVRREFAPYVGLQFERSFGNTRDRRAAAGEKTSDVSFVAGVRFWF